MREFDNRNSWLDDKGQPLVGRVKFCRLHTNELENIYDITGEVVLSNPQFTNNIGQLVNQVFLDDKDYSVRFEKYIGNGRMEDDEDQTNWLFVYSCDNLYETFSIDIQTEGLQSVNTISALRTTDPDTVETRSGKKIVELLGYNEVGDKPVVRYIWNEGSVASDNGGSVIKVFTVATGRWELVNDFNYNTGVDVRHFGVFGKDTVDSIEANMPAKIDVAESYAIEIGIPLYFPIVGDGGIYYKFHGFINGALFQKGVTMIGTTDTCMIKVTDDECGPLIKDNDNDSTVRVELQGYTVKTSWGNGSTQVTFNPSTKLIIDAPINSVSKNFSGITVEGNYDISDCSFDSCVFNVIGKLALNNTFHNCVLRQQMFKETFTATVYDDDTINIEDWPDTNKWLYLITQNSQKVLNFNGRTVDANADIGWANCSYKNAVFNNFNCKQTGTVVFYDCSGTVNLLNDVNIEMKNSELSFITSLDTISSIVSTQNSSITFNGDIYVINMNCNDTTISGGSYVLSLNQNAFIGCTLNMPIVANSFVANKCSINSIITAQTPTIVNSTINSQIIQNSTSATIGFLFSNNIWNEGSKHQLSSIVPGSVVAGSWIDNVSNCSYQFIELDRTNLNPSEQAHSYTYSGNTGKNTLTNKLNKTISLPFSRTSDGVPLNGICEGAKPSGGSQDVVMFGFRSNGTMESGFSDIFNFFTVGTDDFFVTVDWACIGWNGSESSPILANQSVHNYISMTIPNKFTMRARFYSGYGWKLIVPYLGRQYGNSTQPPYEQIIENVSTLTQIGVFTWDDYYPITGSTMLGNFTIEKI